MKELNKIRISGEQQIPRDFLWLKPVNGKYELLRPKGDAWDKILINGMYTKPDSGIPMSDLEESAQESIENKVHAFSIRLEPDYTIVFNPEQTSLLLTVSNYDNSYNATYLIECCDDSSDINITLLSDKFAGIPPSEVQFFSYKGNLLIFNEASDSLDVNICWISKNVPDVHVQLGRPGSIPEYSVTTIIRPADIEDIIIDGNIDWESKPQTSFGGWTFIPARAYSQSEYDSLLEKYRRVVLHLVEDSEYIIIVGKSNVHMYGIMLGLGIVVWGKPNN